MFSKEESIQLKKEFWTAFGKSFPKKWMLYHTKIKDFSFKFYVDNKRAEVALEIEMKDEHLKEAYYNKIWSLEDQLQEAVGLFYKDDSYALDNGKLIGRIWMEKKSVSVFNKNSWPEIFEFFNLKMTAFEEFFTEYEDFIRDV
jgi:hypothetical protein